MITLISLDMLFAIIDQGFVIDNFGLSIFKIHEWNTSYNISDFTLNFFQLAPGAFIALGLILAFMQGKKVRKERRLEEEKKRMIEEKKRIALEKKRLAEEAKTMTKEATV